MCVVGTWNSQKPLAGIYVLRASVSIFQRAHRSANCTWSTSLRGVYKFFSCRTLSIYYVNLVAEDAWCSCFEVGSGELTTRAQASIRTVFAQFAKRTSRRSSHNHLMKRLMLGETIVKAGYWALAQSNSKKLPVDIFILPQSAGAWPRCLSKKM